MLKHPDQALSIVPHHVTIASVLMKPLGSAGVFFCRDHLNGDVIMMNSRHIRELQLRIPWTRIPLTSQLSRRFGSASTYPNPSRSPSRWPRRLIYAGIFGALGVGTGKWVESMIHAPPLPGSIEDQAEMQQIQRRFTLGLPIVQELRENPDYVETDAYEDFSVESKAERLTSGALAGSRGLALQVSGLAAGRQLGGSVHDSGADKP